MTWGVYEMEGFIDRKIRQVLSDFQQQAVEDGGLCVCKNLTYAAGNAPDYGNLLVQQNYMLRFFPAYLVEYYCMYKGLIRFNFLQDQLKVLSIGCGCGVDLWGLNFAVQDTGGDPHERINYTGVDLTNWHYQDDLGIAAAWFINQDITTWTEMDDDDYNVFIFPKCIGEFPEPVFNSICQIFENTQFTENRVCGLCSLMERGLEADQARFRRIAQIMQNTHGYQCLDDLDEYWTVTEDQGLRAICPSFVYPNDIRPHVSALLNECPTFTHNGEPCDDDCENLNRWPILKASFINYNLLRFERG